MLIGILGIIALFALFAAMVYVNADWVIDAVAREASRRSQLIRALRIACVALVILAVYAAGYVSIVGV